MTERRELSETELAEWMATLPGWAVQENKLTKTVKFPSFAAALGFMVTAGIEADKMDHHPEWTNVYNRVTINLTTHDLGNVVSTWDVELAQKMEALLSSAAALPS